MLKGLRILPSINTPSSIVQKLPLFTSALFNNKVILSKDNHSCDNQKVNVTFANDEDRKNLCITASNIHFCHIAILKSRNAEGKVSRMIGWHVGNDALEESNLEHQINEFHKDLALEIETLHKNGERNLSFKYFSKGACGDISKGYSDILLAGMISAQEHFQITSEGSGNSGRSIAIFADGHFKNAYLCKNEKDDEQALSTYNYVQNLKYGNNRSSVAREP